MNWFQQQISPYKNLMRLKKIRNISGSGMQGTVFYSSIDAQVIKVIRYERTCSLNLTQTVEEQQAATAANLRRTRMFWTSE